MIALGQHTYVDEFNKAVDNLVFPDGKSRVELALEKTKTDILTKSGGARVGAEKVAIVVTGGARAYEEDEATSLENAVQALQEEGIRVIMVAVGENVDISELQRIVTDDNDLITTRTYDELLVKSKQIVEHTCQSIGAMILT